MGPSYFVVPMSDAKYNEYMLCPFTFLQIVRRDSAFKMLHNIMITITFCKPVSQQQTSLTT